MLSVFFATLSPMLIMLFMVLTGFFLTKKNIIPKNTPTVLSALETYVFVPCLIVKTFFGYCTFSSMKSNISLVGYCVVVLFVAVFVSFLVSPAFSKDSYEKNIYQYALVFSNFSFLGNSVVPAVLGEEQLYFYMLYTLPLMVLAYSWGVYILIPKENNLRNPLFNLLNPVFISIIVGILGGLLNLGNILPKFVIKSIDSFSACMSPVAMILTGCVVGKYKVRNLLKNKKVYAVCALKLVVLPLAFVFLVKILGGTKEVQILTFFAYGTALGLNTVIFPSAHGKNSEIGASMAMVAQALSIVTIPIIYIFLK